MTKHASKRTQNDPRTKMTPDMPFDGRRMIFGGFDLSLERHQA
ncbi:MAG: hypothetical protein SFX73_04145 [Kofleriaceae bacterium]|nr:hypothetical protein [Kofleriaceae bacterium]